MFSLAFRVWTPDPGRRTLDAGPGPPGADPAATATRSQRWAAVLIHAPWNTCQ